MFFWRSGGSTPTSLESRQSSSCWPGASTAASWPGPARATRGTSPSLLGNAPLPLSNAAFHLPLHPDPFGSSALKINRFLFWMWRVGRISLTVYMNSSFVFQNDWNLRDAVIQLYWCLMKKPECSLEWESLCFYILKKTNLDRSWMRNVLLWENIKSLLLQTSDAENLPGLCSHSVCWSIDSINRASAVCVCVIVQNKYRGK